MKNINKKGEEILTPEFLRTILAIIGLLVLFGLAFKLYQGTSNQDSKKADATLNNIFIKSQSIVGTNSAQNLIMESPNEWELLSLETRAWGLCEGDFCLCLCEQGECEDKKSCKLTGENFFFLKGKDKKPERMISEKMPYGAQISFNNEEVYPFNVEDKSLSDFSEGRYRTFFFRFNPAQGLNGAWEWGYDLNEWFSLDYLSQIRLGPLSDWEIGLKNKDLIIEFNQNVLSLALPENLNDADRKEFLKNEGVEFLSSKGIKTSKGVFVFEVK